MNMRVSILQTDITWEDKEKNLNELHHQLKELQGKTELAILPEMFSTGFTMNSKELAEPVDGKTITTLQTWAKNYQIALVGSYIASDEGKCYNRAFFLTPEGEAHYYDKKHLFRMGSEKEYFSAGDCPKLVVSYRGWNICLLVCYELRFPVWSRNIDNEYDLLIYVANWAVPRRRVWDALLTARAIENMSYVCGVNRVGIDGNKEVYNGGSAIYSPKGNTLILAPDNQVSALTTELSMDDLKAFRKKFPAWMDADHFALLNEC